MAGFEPGSFGAVARLLNRLSQHSSLLPRNRKCLLINRCLTKSDGRRDVRDGPVHELLDFRLHEFDGFAVRHTTLNATDQKPRNQNNKQAIHFLNI